MYGLTRVMNISFDLNDAFFFGAIISATDPGKDWSYAVWTVFVQSESTFCFLNVVSKHFDQDE